MILGTDAPSPLTFNHHHCKAIMSPATASTSTTSILYDLDALDAADARAWHSSRLARVAVPASDALQRYWEIARDPQRSGELYGDAGIRGKFPANDGEIQNNLADTLETYQAFSPCPVDVFDSVKAVLIRREYEAAWRDLESSFVAGRKIFDPAEVATRHAGHPIPAAVAPYRRAYTVTGCSGIGKTLFLALALLRCLERHWTVVLQVDPAFLHVFNSCGVFKLRRSDVERAELRYALPNATWCLVDSNEALESVPQHIIDLVLFIVQAASPEARRTAWQTKTTMITNYYVMRPMSVEEAQLACASFTLVSHGVPRLIFLRFSVQCGAGEHMAAPDARKSSEIIREYFDKYGPDTPLAFQAAMRRGSWEDGPAARLDGAIAERNTAKVVGALAGIAFRERNGTAFRELNSAASRKPDGAAKLQKIFYRARLLRVDDDAAYALLVVHPGETRRCAQVDFASAHVRGRCLEAFPGLDV
ncbi:uncharacterized protein SCHCODRAFT_02714834 [Schizophyllum commune H4-8]|nr:uncharacterized protein SCHCODRAFT_02714834 [Schizophyllum commune H4-8]KAI5886907.1 hypothetical protein SCHCODRAFT_02714834 [Schizophyllum commune H4-8]